MEELCAERAGQALAWFAYNRELWNVQARLSRLDYECQARKAEMRVEQYSQLDALLKKAELLLRPTVDDGAMAAYYHTDARLTRDPDGGDAPDIQHAPPGRGDVGDKRVRSWHDVVRGYKETHQHLPSAFAADGHPEVLKLRASACVLAPGLYELAEQTKEDKQIYPVWWMAPLSYDEANEFLKRFGAPEGDQHYVKWASGRFRFDYPDKRLLPETERLVQLRGFFARQPVCRALTHTLWPRL